MRAKSDNLFPPENVEHIMEEGACAVLHKPFDLGELIQLVEETAAAKRSSARRALAQSSVQSGPISDSDPMPRELN